MKFRVKLDCQRMAILAMAKNCFAWQCCFKYVGQYAVSMAKS